MSEIFCEYCGEAFFDKWKKKHHELDFHNIPELEIKITDLEASLAETKQVLAEREADLKGWHDAYDRYVVIMEKISHISLLLTEEELEVINENILTAHNGGYLIPGFTEQLLELVKNMKALQAENERLKADLQIARFPNRNRNV